MFTLKKFTTLLLAHYAINRLVCSLYRYCIMPFQNKSLPIKFALHRCTKLYLQLNKLKIHKPKYLFLHHHSMNEKLTSVCANRIWRDPLKGSLFLPFDWVSVFSSRLRARSFEVDKVEWILIFQMDILGDPILHLLPVFSITSIVLNPSLVQFGFYTNHKMSPRVKDFVYIERRQGHPIKNAN